MVANVKPRVVFDTNVLLSALLFRSSRVAWLVPSWQQGRLTPLLSREVAGELVRVLAYPKFHLSVEERHAVLSAFVPYADIVVTRPWADAPRCRDPHDVKFLTLADQGQADYLVTGDADLHAVQGFSACPIMNPEAFRQILTSLDRIE